VARHPEARAHLARRYQAAWAGVDEAVAEWTEPGTAVGPALIGVLLGLEMMRRVDPSAVHDEMAIAALRGVVHMTTGATR
jgi:hypothetical protein